jgi:energy-coupling factor transporter ATP-binding protein EcfA2
MILDINAIDYIKPKEPLNGLTLEDNNLYFGFTYPKTKKQLQSEVEELLKNNKGVMRFQPKPYINCYLKKNKDKYMIITENDEEFKIQNFRYQLTSRDITISSKKIKQILTNDNIKVNEQELYETIKNEVKQYVYLKNETEYDIVVLYIMLTYVYLLLDFFPILHLNGDAGTGKSQLVKIMTKLAINSSLTVSATSSSFFRRIDKRRGLYGMDEKEKLEEYEKELLNGCTYEGNVHTVTEKINDTFHEQEFNIYTPVVLACINELYGATSTRTLKIETIKSPKQNNKYSVIRVTDDKNEWVSIRDNIILFWLNNQKMIKNLMVIDETITKTVSNRNVDVWKTIINLSKHFGKEKQIYKYINDIYLEQIEENHENDIEVKFYIYLQRLNNNDWVHANNLFKEFINMELTEKQREFFTQTKFGRCMRKIGYSKSNNNKKRTYNGNEYKLDKNIVEKYIKNTYDFSDQILQTKKLEIIEEINISD